MLGFSTNERIIHPILRALHQSDKLRNTIINEDMKPPESSRYRSARYFTVAAVCVATVIASIVHYQQVFTSLFLATNRPSFALRDQWRELVEHSAAAERNLATKPVDYPASYTPEWLQGTAAVTLAAGDDAGRLAVALVQSLRESKTQIPNIVVMLARGGRGSADCQNETWKRAHGREKVRCQDPTTIEGEIVSARYLEALRRLGATTTIVDTIPETEWTSKIPGGRTVFWGMAFQKLHIFNFTQFRKLLWMDADTMVLHNMDHLLKEPMFTAAYTHACCNPNAPAVPSGGLWVVEPSIETGVGLWRMMNGPLPGSNVNSSLYERYWMYGDMQLVRYYFGNMTVRSPNQPLWPFVEDSSHGTVPNLRVLPQYAKASDKQITDASTWRHGGPLQGQVLPHGFVPEWSDGSRPMFRCLDGRYDQCVGMCECLPQRDLPDEFFSVHFSCLNGLKKPSEYESERELGETMYRYGSSCQRHYFWHKWYAFFKKGYGRFPAPFYEGPDIPGYNVTHDALVTAWRLERQKR